MLLDYDNEFTRSADGTSPGAQAVTATANGRNILGPFTGRDWGSGETVYPYARVDAAFDNLTSLKVDIVASDNADLSSGVVLSTKTILLAALTADSLHALPPLLAGSPRAYLGCILTVTGSAPSAGSIVVGLKSRDGGPQNKVSTI